MQSLRGQLAFLKTINPPKTEKHRTKKNHRSQREKPSLKRMKNQRGTAMRKSQKRQYHLKR
jgi:hypothetical protein